MEISKIKSYINDLLKDLGEINEKDMPRFNALHARAVDFSRSFLDKNSAFLAKIEFSKSGNSKASAIDLIEVLKSLDLFLDSGFYGLVSLKRQAEIDVISDLLDQAQSLLNIKGVHPAAPAVLIGATLEEFLRNWVEDEALSLDSRKPSIDTYANTLKSAELISKQDVKDITSWGGLRNYAAHGQWEELGTKENVQLMLAGVNLFMRKYGKS